MIAVVIISHKTKSTTGISIRVYKTTLYRWELFLFTFWGPHPSFLTSPIVNFGICGKVKKKIIAVTTDVKWVTMSSRVNSYARESGNKKEQIITNKQIWPRGWSEGNSEVSFCLSSLLIARLHSIFACIKILKRSRIFLGIHYPLAFRTKHLFAMSRCMKLFYEIARVDFFIIRRFFTHHSKNILTQ